MKGNSDTLRFVNDHFAHQMMKGLKDIYEEDFECLDDDAQASDDELSLKAFGSADIDLLFMTKLRSTPDQVGGFLKRLGVATEISRQKFLVRLCKELQKNELSKEEADAEVNVWKQALVRMGFHLSSVDEIMEGQQALTRNSGIELVKKNRHDLVYFSQDEKNVEKMEAHLLSCLEELETNTEELEKYMIELGLYQDEAKLLVSSLGLNRLKTEICLSDFDLSLESATLILSLLGYSELEVDELLGFQGFFDFERQMLA